MKRAVLMFIAIIVLASPGAAQATSGSARGAVNGFFAAWKRQDFRAMYNATNYSWRHGSGNNATTLRNQYDFKRVTSFKIVKVHAGALAQDITIRVTYKVFNSHKTVRITAKVLKETRGGDLSPSGKWGVNPISTLREN